MERTKNNLDHSANYSNQLFAKVRLVFLNNVTG